MKIVIEDQDGTPKSVLEVKADERTLSTSPITVNVLPNNAEYKIIGEVSIYNEAITIREEVLLIIDYAYHSFSIIPGNNGIIDFQLDGIHISKRQNLIADLTKYAYQFAIDQLTKYHKSEL